MEHLLSSRGIVYYVYSITVFFACLLICARFTPFQGVDASHINEAMDLAARFASMKLS